MSRSGAALVFALTAQARAGDCPPHAQLDGDAAAVASVSAELVKLGMTVSAAASACKTVIASVELGRDGGIAVAVKHNGQSEGREVSDPVIAASWINSWAIDEFDPGSPDGPPLAPPAMTRTSALTDELHASTVVPARSSLGIAVSAGLDQAWTFDGTRWSGFSAGACVEVGAWCFGARGRYATQELLVGQTAAARDDLSALATASYAKTVGRVAIVPELGLGVGRMETSRIAGCREVPTCDPHDQGCMVPPVKDDCIARDPEHAYTLDLHDNLHASTITPRVAAALRISVPLANHVWLDGLAAVMLSPLEHAEPYEFAAGVQPPFGIPPDQLALPGESIGTFEVGISLRVGTL